MLLLPAGKQGCKPQNQRCAECPTAARCEQDLSAGIEVLRDPNMYNMWCVEDGAQSRLGNLQPTNLSAGPNISAAFYLLSCNCQHVVPPTSVQQQEAFLFGAQISNAKACYYG